MANKWTQIASECERFALEAKKEWGELTEEELIQVEGKCNTLAGVVQKRYFTSTKEAHTQIEAWIETLKP